MIGRHFTPVLILFFAVSLAGAPAETLDQILARMDQNAATFKSMTAKIRQVSHFAVIKDDDVSEGTTRIKRSKRERQVLIEFTSPDEKSLALSGTKGEVYRPKLQTVEEYDLGKNRDLLEQYLLLGPGASGKDLKAEYSVRLAGEEPVNGQPAARLELIPKSKQMLQQFPRIELWISEKSGYPVQQKLYQTGGDYIMVTYTDMIINPSLPASAFKLNLPTGVKRVFPQK
jgi:outer membrane lipoprotein-sorting protein